jgi:glycosyltransferase involved in cell wall biosynthesis
MDHKPLVSVIVIFLNAEEFISEAVESVFAQTYDNWELMLVNDGSTDASTEIALRFAEKYSDRVRYLQHEEHQNRGKSASRNLGIRNSKGEYIAFLDADDVYLPHKLEEQVPLLHAHPEAAMLFGRTWVWYGWTGKPEDIERDYMTEFPFPPNTLVVPPTLLIRFLISERYLPCNCSVLVRREIIDRVGGFEESFRKRRDDMAFNAKVYLEAPVLVADGCWDRYRQHPGSSRAVSIAAGQYDSYRAAYLNWLSGYLSKKGFKDTEVWRVLQKELWPYRHPSLHRLSKRAQQFVRNMIWLSIRIARRTLPVPVYRWLRAKKTIKAQAK